MHLVHFGAFWLVRWSAPERCVRSETLHKTCTVQRWLRRCVAYRVKHCLARLTDRVAKPSSGASHQVALGSTQGKPSLVSASSRCRSAIRSVGPATCDHAAALIEGETRFLVQWVVCLY